MPKKKQALTTSVMGFDCLYFRADQVIDCSIFCDSIAAGAMDEQKRVQDSTLDA